MATRARDYGINACESRTAAVEPHSTSRIVTDSLRFSVAHTSSARRSSIAAHSRPSRSNTRWAKPISTHVRNERRSGERGSWPTHPRELRQSFFTTREMIALERDNLDLMLAGQRRTHPIATTDRGPAWAPDGGLLADQAEAAKSYSQRGTGSPRSKAAPAAPRPLLSARLRICPRARLLGARLRADHARGQGAFRSRCPRPHCGEPGGKITPDPPAQQFWIVDESSLLPTRQVNRLLHQSARGEVRAHRLSSATNISITPSRRGGRLSDAAGGHAVARLEIIRRQRDPKLREAVSLPRKAEIAEHCAAREARSHPRDRSIQSRYEASREYGCARGW